jgi:DNA-binding transcriptional MerR regulator
MLPEKYFYTIGDVARITSIRPHILRYWESQFKILKPARRYSGHRKYTQREIDLINRIRYLVVDRKYTLAGAKREINRHVNADLKEGEVPSDPHVTTALPVLREIKNDVEECLQILNAHELDDAE